MKKRKGVKLCRFFLIICIIFIFCSICLYYFVGEYWYLDNNNTSMYVGTVTKVESEDTDDGVRTYIYMKELSCPLLIGAKYTPVLDTDKLNSIEPGDKITIGFLSIANEQMYDENTFLPIAYLSTDEGVILSFDGYNSRQGSLSDARATLTKCAAGFFVAAVCLCVILRHKTKKERETKWENQL